MNAIASSLEGMLAHILTPHSRTSSLRSLLRLTFPDSWSRGTKTWGTRVSTPVLDRGQTKEICEKQEKYFKGKVVTLTVQRLILNQYPVDLLTFLKLYLKCSKCLEMGKFGLVDAICQSNFVGGGRF